MQVALPTTFFLFIFILSVLVSGISFVPSLVFLKWNGRRGIESDDGRAIDGDPFIANVKQPKHCLLAIVVEFECKSSTDTGWKNLTMLSFFLYLSSASLGVS